MDKQGVLTMMSGKSKILVFSLIAVALAMGAAICTYYWRQDKIDALDAQVAQLQGQLTTAKSKTPEDKTTYTSVSGVDIRVFLPESGAKISSQQAVIGQVPGNWSFEASFPVRVINSSGDIVFEGPAQIIGDWMTEELRAFYVLIDYSSVQSGNGTLVLQKDNPSGLPENDDSLTIPIRF